MTWRTVTDKRGTWRERDKPGHSGTVERVRIDEGESLIRGTAERPRLVEGRSRSATSTGIEVLDAPATFTLKLGMSVRGEIEGECRRVNEIAHVQVGRPAESGGYLFSHYGPRADGAHVVYATASAEEHTTHSVLLCSPTDVKRDIAAGLHGEGLARAGLRLIGNWHSHPWFEPAPSPQDHENWGEHLRRTGADSWVSVIVTPARPGDGVGWSIPQLHAYRTFWDPAERWGAKPVCSPARIVE